MPSKPVPPTADDERRKDAAAEADRLGREHSNKRDLKARADRLRTAGDEPRPPRPATGVPGVPGAPVLQPNPRRAESRPEIRLPESDPPAPPRELRLPPTTAKVERPPRDDRPREERPERPREERAERPREERPREERPREERPREERPREERPREERPREERAERPREERRDRQRPREEPERHNVGVIDEVAVEAEEFIRDYAGLWRRFAIADKITVVAAITTLLGTFLPWLWRAHEEVVIGLGCGGVVHAVIACASIGLLVRRDRPALDERGLRPTPARQRQLARRTALWLLLLSLLSTVAGTWFLLVYGAVRRFEVPTLEVGVGLYVALAAGLGLSYSGFAFFWRLNRDGGRAR